MRIQVLLLCCLAALGSGCGDRSAADSAAAPSTAVTPTSASVPPVPLDAAGKSEFEFPAIPPIMVPSIVGSSEAQRALERSMQSLINPIAGITIRPANCATDGALINETGFTNVDSRGNLERISKEGIFNIAPDGSGTSVGSDHGSVDVHADGSGMIVNDAGSFEVHADGSGTYVGEFGNIDLDGKGRGTWVGEHGNIEINGDGSGSWVGDEGSIEVGADGSGRWIGGPEGIVVNRGDGTGTVGASEREVKMAPLSPVPPAGRFPLLDKFSPPGAPCGFVITLNDHVLFDFDKSDIRTDAGDVLDKLAAALDEVSAKTMEVRGHTDSKGSDDYNQSLSERRAKSVVAALRQRNAAIDASALGFGASQPVAPNEISGKDNPGGRQLNRRVEIFVRT